MTVSGLSQCMSCRLAGLNFATADRSLHDQAETGNPRHVGERPATVDEIIEFCLHVEADAGTIGVGGEVLSELWRLFSFFDAVDSAYRGSQTLGGNSESDKRITEEPVHLSNQLRRIERPESIEQRARC